MCKFYFLPSLEHELGGGQGCVWVVPAGTPAPRQGLAQISAEGGKDNSPSSQALCWVLGLGQDCGLWGCPQWQRGE